MGNEIQQSYFQVGLMRHPPVNVPVGLCYGHMDVPLKTEWEQYAVLPDGFQDIQIYTSPATRCLKLAKKIAEKYYLSYQIEPKLLEFHFGDWEGKLWDNLPKSFIDEWAKDPWGWKVPGGENGQQLFNRVHEVWQEIQQKQKNALIVSHGGPLRLLHQVAINKYPIELLGDLPDFGKLVTFNFRLK